MSIGRWTWNGLVSSTRSLVFFNNKKFNKTMFQSKKITLVINMEIIKMNTQTSFYYLKSLNNSQHLKMVLSLLRHSCIHIDDGIDQ